MEAIEVTNLQKTFKTKGKKIKALDGMSFAVKRGELCGFLGPNGAGKSTTLKVLMDLIKPDKGEAKILGIDSKNCLARLKVGFMPENPQYPDTLTGYELLMLSASIFNIPKKQAQKKAWDLLQAFELKNAAKVPIRTYSKGMIQRIGFASVLIHDPELLILDEPLSGLDPLGRVMFKKKMKELNKEGKTIFFSSHIIPDIEDVCSKVIIVNKGNVVKTLDKNQIKYFSTVGFNVIINSYIDSLCPKKIGDNLYAVYCKKENLISCLDVIRSNRGEIIDIEPVKKSLEEVFVQITQNFI
ncbi:MAG: ABC transporter ATP-binding protein [Desulfonauticus sp.]|nr:ABC transporter ATP-binding protein [Desulfonauticus sp.]